MTFKLTPQSRWKSPTPRHGRVLTLDGDDPAVVFGRTKHLHLVKEVDLEEAPLKSGFNNRKIGDKITKGRWRGFPIFTLTLEERATCPRTCDQWHICYGNHMSQARAYRYKHGPDLEQQIERQLSLLNREPKTRNGFAVRLHVLGDFYSLDYVRRWEEWLHRFDALHCFGFTAHRRDSEIGRAIGDMADTNWSRFAIRFSEPSNLPRSAGLIQSYEDRPSPTEAIVCPAETQVNRKCSTCGYCWNSQKRVLFVEH